MRRLFTHAGLTATATAMALALTVAAGPVASAGPPPHAGGGKSGPPAHAQQGGGKGGPAGRDAPRQGGGHGKVHTGPDRGGSINVDIVIQPDARGVIRDYYRTTYGQGCPPGLAKKNNGCLPPGQAKKRWAIGQPLPQGVVIDGLPPHLAGRLPPPPGGYYYGMVDREVLLIGEASKKVIDAVVILSGL